MDEERKKHFSHIMIDIDLAQHRFTEKQKDSLAVYILQMYAAGIIPAKEAAQLAKKIYYSK